MSWLRAGRQIAAINVIKVEAVITATEHVWGRLFTASPAGKAPSLLARSMSGFLSGFYRRVDILLARVETVQ